MRYFRSGLLLSALFTLASFSSAEARSEKLLYSFTDSNNDLPSSALIMDANGNFFGTTQNGGSSAGWGTVFSLTPGGKETTLYTFVGGSDGAQPRGGLVMDANGNLYGTTAIGGANNRGTVFKLTPDGKKKILYSFKINNDAYHPDSPLIIDADGNMYGTTLYGGAADRGSVFKVTSKGRETVLFSFAGGNDGYNPQGGVIMDARGNLYGTTEVGGTSDSGTVFKLTPNGKKTVLYSFTGGSDGGVPVPAPIMDGNGNLYGTTTVGGDDNAGVVFKLTPEGQETVLYSFAGGDDGFDPVSGLIMDAGGNLYGTTTAGGTGDYGTVFKLTPKNKKTVLHSFTGSYSGNGVVDGALPMFDVVMDARGTLYGTTPQGGQLNGGAAYKIGK